MAPPRVPSERDPLLAASSVAASEPTEPSNRELLAILSGVYLGAFVAAVDATLVATLSGPISTAFDNMPLLGWLASAFFIATTVTQPLAGKLSDIYGRRAGLLLANAVFALGNLLCALAGAEWMLLLGRAVAGLGGGGIAPLASVVMSDLVPLRRRGLWQGIGNVCFGIGSGLGGPVGGWIAHALGWRWAFAVQVPISFLAMVLIAYKVNLPMITKAGDTAYARLARVDGLGALLLSTALVLSLLGLHAGGNLVPWTHPLVVTALPLAAVTFAAFAYVETYVAAEPILPPRLLRLRTVAAVCLANWLQSMARFGLLFHLPLYFQVQGLDASAAGVRFLPESVAIAFTSLTAGYLMQRTGRYYRLLLGAETLFVAALALVAALRLDTPGWLPFIYLFFVGMGFSAMLTTTLVALLAAADRADAAVAISASYACRSTGSALGIAFAAASFRNVLRPGLRRAVHGHPDASALVRKLERNLELLNGLEPEVRARVQDAYMLALRASFVVLLVLGVLGAVAGAFVAEHKLHSKLSRRASGDVGRASREGEESRESGESEESRQGRDREERSNGEPR